MAEKKQSFEYLLRKVRTSYFYGFKPYKGDDGKESYCTHLILGRDHVDFGPLQALIKSVAVAEWGDGADAVLKQLVAQDRLCIHNGDVNKPGEDAYKGKVYVSTNSKKRFTIIDRDRSPLTEADGKPVSGDMVNAKINLWAQNNQFGKRINAQIMGVQFVQEMEHLSGGGRVAAAEEFGIEADTADEAAPPSGGEGLI